MGTKITINEASKAIGISAPTLRNAIKKGYVPFGSWYENETGRCTYIIYPEEFKRYVGHVEERNKERNERLMRSLRRHALRDANNGESEGGSNTEIRCT